MVRALACQAKGRGFEPRRPRQTDTAGARLIWLVAPLRIRVERDGRRKAYLDPDSVRVEVAALN